MTTKRLYLKILGLLMMTVTIAFLVIGPLLPRLVDISTYQQQIITLLEDSLKRKISLGELRFAWRFGPEFIIQDLHLRERTSNEEFLTARKVTIRLGLLPLLRRQVALRSIVVDGLQARIVRDAEGALNISDLLEPQAGGVDLQVGSIKLRQGSIAWQDHACDDGVHKLSLSNLELALGRLSRGKKCTYKLSATLGNGSIKGTGSIKFPQTGEPFKTALQVNGNLALKQLNYGALWPYYGQYIPFDRPGGTLDLEAQMKGTPDRFTGKGLLRLHNAKVVWPTVFHGPVAPKLAQVQFELKRTPTSIDLPVIQLNADGFAFRGSLKLSDLLSSDPYLAAKGISEPFEYQEVRSYIPFGIIADEATDFIKHKIRAGRFKLVNGTLEGRFSKLVRFTEGDNANALFINGTAERAVISYGSPTPSFNNLKGNLEMKGRNFNLQGMSGAFGGSPFTMQGSITDYSTQNVPSTYPFQMEITPKPAEIAWLARQVGADKLTFSGNSSLRLTGEGELKAYRLSGDWQLNQATYEFPSVIRKPAGIANNLSFSSLINKQETRLTALAYSLPPLQLSGLATFRYGAAAPHLSFEVQTNRFALSPQVPILPDWQQFQPKGVVQAHLFGAGDPRDFSAMLYNGAIRLSGFSVRPLATHPPLSAINGQISFKGNSLSTSSIAVRYGKTALELRGRIASLKSPEAELFISSPELQLGDFGLKTNELLSIRQFSTSLAFRKGLYTIRNLSGHLGETIFSAAGTIRPTPEPDISLRLTANHLNIDEWLPLLMPQQPATPATAERRDTVKPFKLHGQLTADTGSFSGLHFSKLRALFLNDGDLLRLQNLETRIFGGQLAAQGQLEQVTGQPLKWALTMALDRVKSDELLHSLGISREISGLTTIKGSLRAQGETLEELKRTTAGNLSLKIERGVLRRFNSLSKVFSLLNVSQLLTFQLPDMSTEGMPFNQITTTVGIKDGLVTTRDFFIESNAIHLSMVGKINFIKEDMDLLIGVQPLQTVDKVISRIPVVGWILTGGDGSLITTYFEAKGSWADPQVTAIPVKSMASGTLNIFRRVFELPVRLFTDSGEVILGNQKERPKAKQE